MIRNLKCFVIEKRVNNPLCSLQVMEIIGLKTRNVLVAAEDRIAKIIEQEILAAKFVVDVDRIISKVVEGVFHDSGGHELKDDEEKRTNSAT